MYQFCSRACSDDYKKLHCIVTYCEYCQEEKTLHETVNFSGIKRPFCSEGMYGFVFFYIMLKFKITHSVVHEAKPEVSSLLLLKWLYLLLLVQILFIWAAFRAFQHLVQVNTLQCMCVCVCKYIHIYTHIAYTHMHQKNYIFFLMYAVVHIQH